MNKSILVGAVIIAIAILLAAAMHTYFSPYWSCVRAMKKGGEVDCALYTGGRGG